MITKKTNRLVRLFLCLLVSINGLGQYNSTKEIENAYSNFLKLKIAQAQSQIRTEIKKDPDNLLAVYIEDYADFFTLVIEENRKDYYRLKNNENIRLKKIKKGENNNPYYYFLQAEIKIHWAIIKFKFGEEISASYAIWQAWQLLETCLNKYPDFIPAQKSLGVLHIVASNIPENYYWILKLVGINPDFKLGTKYLENAIKNNSFFQKEAHLVQLMIFSNLLKQEKNILETTEKLLEHEPDNLLIRFLVIQTQIKNKLNDNTLATLSNYQKGNEYIKFSYLYYKTADCYLFKNDYANAKKHYLLFLEEYNGENYIKSAYYKIAIAENLMGNPQTALEYLHEIKKIGKTITEEDKFAENIAQKGFLPNKQLTISRLYFDGGYYEKALNTLNNLNKEKSTKEEIAEYHYRKARIHENQNNLEIAKIEYKAVITNYNIPNLYFAPNSALQLGYIYQKENKLDSAKHYFNKCLTYTKYPYKNSLDAKAKAALNALK